ncbi:hypothetical protein D3C77_455360 [compost metagenome]
MLQPAAPQRQRMLEIDAVGRGNREPPRLQRQMLDVPERNNFGSLVRLVLLQINRNFLYLLLLRQLDLSPD